MNLKRIAAGLLVFVALCVPDNGAKARFPHGAPSGLTNLVQPVKVGAGGWLVGGDVLCDSTCGNGIGTSTKLTRTDTYGAYNFNNTAANPGNAGGTGAFQQVVNSSSMPIADQIVNDGTARGTVEIRAAPSNTQHLYMLWGQDGQHIALYASTDKGGSWTKKTGFTTFFMQNGPNDAYRTNGHFIAIDPANENILYVGTPSSGVFITTDGGTTFGSSLTTPSTANGQWSEPAFDTSGGTSTGALCPNSVSVCTKNAVICTNGTGVYRSINSGSSWVALNTTGMPTSCAHTKVDQNGIIWVTIGGGQQGTGGSASISFYKAGAWNTVATGVTGNLQSAAVDPSNGNNVVVINTGGSLSASYDQGATWTFLGVNSTRSATDIPWLATTNEASLSSGDIAFDPAVSRWTTSTDSKSLAAAGGSMSITTAATLGFANGTVVTMYRTSDPTKRIQGTVTSNVSTNLQFTYTANGSTGTAGPFTDWTIGTNDLIFFEGIGVFHITPPATSGLGPGNYVSMSTSIEQLVPRWIVSPWGASACSTLGTSTSVPIFSAEDRPLFAITNPDVYPSHHGVADNATGGAVQRGWSVAWAGQSPQKLAAIVSGQLATSSDCGATWAYGSTKPLATSGDWGGSIAIAATTTNNIVWQQSSQGPGYFTADGGSTWTQMSFPNVPSAGGLATSAGSSVGAALQFSSIPSWLSTGIASGASYSFFDLTQGNGNGVVTGVSGNTITVSGAGGGAILSGDVIAFQVNMGFGGAGFTMAQNFAADYVNDQTFHAFNMGVGTCINCSGIYGTTSGGSAWIQECSGNTNPTTCPNGNGTGLLAQIRAVPGHANEFWVTTGAHFGATGHPDSTIPFWKCLSNIVSNVGTTTCSKPNSNVQEVWAFGFGKAVAGGYPAIYIYGWVTTDADPTNPGVFRSDDAGLNWTRMSGAFPGGSIDSVTTVEGDANIYGRVYIGIGGDGWVRIN